MSYQKIIDTKTQRLAVFLNEEDVRSISNALNYYYFERQKPLSSEEGIEIIELNKTLKSALQTLVEHNEKRGV